MRPSNPAVAELVLRRATPEDSPLLYRWDDQPHVRAAVSNDGMTAFEANWEEELAPEVVGSAFYIAEVDAVPIGAMQVIDPAREETHYWGAIAPNLRAIDIWIGELAYLGKGYGTQMMTTAIDRCFADPAVKAIVIDPLANNTRAHRFYQRLGFRFVERRQFDAHSDCFVFRLQRADWERRG